MVEAEEEYVSQLEVLVTCFLRPLRMAASSKKPPCTHEDISSIFLNSETVLFLHQIFYKGLTTRMENWPTLILSKYKPPPSCLRHSYRQFDRNTFAIPLTSQTLLKHNINNNIVHLYNTV